jgi:chromatin remodeling complex protein RSC6
MNQKQTISAELAAFLEHGSDTDMVKEIKWYLQFYQLHNSPESLVTVKQVKQFKHVDRMSRYVNPTRISDKLATFLRKEFGTEMARVNATLEINKYIKDNGLQDGRKINPDNKLKILFNLQVTDELTVLNLQKYISPHFPR